MAHPCLDPACPNTPVVQWQRRPSPAELEQIRAAEEDRRARIIASLEETRAALRAAAEAEGLPEPEFRPLPNWGDLPGEDAALAVFACPDHAIPLDAAAHVHAADCPASAPGGITACACPAPPPVEPEPQPEPVTLPSGWTVHLPGA